MNLRLAALVLAIYIATVSLCAGQVSSEEIRTAAAKSVALLQKASAAWFEKRSCTSCHHQNLPLMLFDTARHRGLGIDQHVLETVVTRSFGHLTDLDRAVQGSHLVDPVLTMAYSLGSAA